jgi:membrane-anchored protein YejM (alkaline phosphatase superfamily)
MLLPGTAFKFCNHLNAEATAKALLSKLDAKNIAFKIHTIAHRINPIYPQALLDTLSMVKILVKEERIKRLTIITWSSGCCNLN